MTAGLEVLVVEDDEELAQLLDRLLTKQGYAVDVATDGLVGLHQALERTYDVVVLDRSLPSAEGLDVLQTWRDRGVGTPVLVLSARNTVGDRVVGLDAGAEDYLGKPFDVTELFARLRALVRRYPVARPGTELPGGWRLDRDTRVARAGDREVSLTPREAALLTALVDNAGRVATRDELQEQVFPGTRAAAVVDMNVSALRRKLGREIIVTVYGVGFRLGS